MIRMSSLPIAQYCALAPKLYAEHGAGRSAAISQAFHARCAGDESLMLQLTDAERAELREWKRPADVVLPIGIGGDVGSATLRYTDAEKEIEVCLSEMGMPCNREEAMLVGHLDFAWSRHSIAFVADIKKSRWTTVDGPETLQLHAYAMAYAQMRGCEAYCTGIWLPVDGEWMWSRRTITLGSPEHAEIWARILWAASEERPGQPTHQASTGPHCDNCYARLHCPEHVLSAVLSTTELAPVAAGQVPTSEKAAQMLRWISLLDGDNGLLAKAKDQLRQWVKRGELQVSDGNKIWGPVAMPGRKSLDRGKLEKQLGDLGAYESVGAPYDQFRWLKRKA